MALQVVETETRAFILVGEVTDSAGRELMNALGIREYTLRNVNHSKELNKTYRTVHVFNHPTIKGTVLRFLLDAEEET